MSAPTGRALMAAAAEQLAQAGVPDVGRDAQLLFQHALEQELGSPVPRHRLPDHLDAVATDGLAARYHALIGARVARQPVSQIIGRRSFWKHDFRVTGDTLDPRPDTETLIEAALALPWRNVLDLGTGTGAILISLLAERQGAAGVGTDISEAALAIARENATRIGVEADFRQADWFRGIGGRFDLIVSNPPYIALSEMADLAPEVREWEPHGALTDGGDGLSAYRMIAAGAADHLNPDGHMLVEIGAGQGEDVAAIFQAQGAVTRVIQDLDGRNRVVHAKFQANLR